MKNGIKLSPSALHLYEDCPLCFWMHHVKGVKHPSTIFPSLPSGMDKILKAHFDTFRANGRLPPELNELSDVRLFDNMELLDVWRNNRKGIIYEDKKTGAILRGAVDDMLENDGKLIVLDFKTRGFPLKEDTHENYQSQLDIYTYLLEKNGFDVENYSYLLFYYPEKVNGDGSVVFHTKLVKMKTEPKNAEKLFKSAVKVLQSEESPDAAEGCGYCGFIRARESDD